MAETRRTKGRPRLSQHFLIDRSVAHRIVRSFGPQEADRVVEVGPGHGVLTRRVARCVARLAAVELDPHLAATLAEELGGLEGVSVVQGDALELDLPGLVGSLEEDAEPPRMLSNLPYAISSPFILALLEKGGFRDAHLMLQSDFARRLVARPGTKAYGSLTVLAAARARVSWLFEAGPGCFRPRPRVRSAFVRLELDPAPAAPPWEELKRITRLAFQARRKRLDKALSLALGREWAAELLARAGVDPGLRPDALAPEAYLTLAQLVAAEGSPSF